MNATTTVERPEMPELPPQPAKRDANPWASDEMLLGLSVWWVRSTSPDSHDFNGEVAVVFRDLQDRLQ
jgi:hypothetical protein